MLSAASKSLESVHLSLQFVHRVISDLCGKDGLHYEEFAKSISLSEYSRLKLNLNELLNTL